MYHLVRGFRTWNIWLTMRIQTKKRKTLSSGWELVCKCLSRLCFQEGGLVVVSFT